MAGNGSNGGDGNRGRYDLTHKPVSLEELEFSRQEWQIRLETAEARVKELEHAHLTALMNGKVGGNREELAAAKADTNEARLVLAEINKQLPASEAESLRRRAAGLKAEADKLEAEAEQIEQQIAPLLDQIEALEGVRYTAPPASRFGRGGTQAKSGMLRSRAFRLREQAEDLLITATQRESAPTTSKQGKGVPGWQFRA